MAWCQGRSPGMWNSLLQVPVMPNSEQGTEPQSPWSQISTLPVTKELYVAVSLLSPQSSHLVLQTGSVAALFSNLPAYFVVAVPSTISSKPESHLSTLETSRFCFLSFWITCFGSYFNSIWEDFSFCFRSCFKFFWPLLSSGSHLLHLGLMGTRDYDFSLETGVPLLTLIFPILTQAVSQKIGVLLQFGAEIGPGIRCFFDTIVFIYKKRTKYNRNQTTNNEVFFSILYTQSPKQSVFSQGYAPWFFFFRISGLCDFFSPTYIKLHNSQKNLSIDIRLAYGFWGLVMYSDPYVQ